MSNELFTISFASMTFAAALLLCAGAFTRKPRYTSMGLLAAIGTAVLYSKFN